MRGCTYAKDICTNHSGMLYLRARWYQPHTGRFFSPDTIIPDFQNPQSVNRYLYTLGNPVKYIDPSGHSPPGTICSQIGCDPSDEPATQWLLATMCANAVGPEAQAILQLNQLASAGQSIPVPFLLPPIPLLPRIIVVPCSPLSIPPKVLAYRMWIQMVRTGAPWDYKLPVLYRRRGFEWGGANIRMCCDWYWYEAVANIHYGYVGKAAGFTSLELKAGAGAFQYWESRDREEYQEMIEAGEVGLHTYFDEPEDQAGIQLGLDLYNERRSLNPQKFCEIFDRWSPQLKPANWWDTAPGI